MLKGGGRRNSRCFLARSGVRLPIPGNHLAFAHARLPAEPKRRIRQSTSAPLGGGRLREEAFAYRPLQTQTGVCLPRISLTTCTCHGQAAQPLATGEAGTGASDSAGVACVRAASAPREESGIIAARIPGEGPLARAAASLVEAQAAASGQSGSRRSERSGCWEGTCPLWPVGPFHD